MSDSVLLALPESHKERGPHHHHDREDDDGTVVSCTRDLAEVRYLHLYIIHCVTRVIILKSFHQESVGLWL